MDELKEILLSSFSTSQKTIGEHTKGIQKVREVLVETIKEDQEGQGKEKIIEEFHKALFKNVCKFLVIDDTKQNSSVQRIIQFTAKLVQSLTTSGDDDEAGDFLLNSLCKASGSSSKVVRLRSVQVIVAVLDLLSDDVAGEGFELDESVFGTLVECMTRRARDRNAAVRLEAILALSRLQNPEDREDPVIELFIHSMEVDPSPFVRKAVLLNIAITSLTLKHILRRIRDSSDSVRATAFRVLSEKVDVRSLSIKQKVSLVSAGNGDRSSTVRNIFTSMVRDQWLTSLSQNNDPVAVIGCIDPAEHEEEAEALAHCLLGVPRPKENKETKKGKEDGEKEPESGTQTTFLSKESPSAEEALWWRVQCMEALKDDPLSVPEDLISDLTTLAGTIARMAKASPFVCSQVLRVAEAAARGSSDVVGRIACAEALCELLKSGDVSDSLVDPILEALGAAWASPEEGKRILLEDVLGHLFATGEEKLDFLEVYLYRIALITCFGLCSCRECFDANEVDHLFQKVALPCIQHREARVREVGVKIAAVSCIVAPYAETLNSFLPIIILALKNDQTSVRCVAAKGLFDIVGMFGFEKLEAAITAVDVQAELLSTFNEISCDEVNSDDADLLTAFAEGFAKLFFLGVINKNTVIRSDANNNNNKDKGKQKKGNKNNKKDDDNDEDNSDKDDKEGSEDSDDNNSDKDDNDNNDDDDDDKDDDYEEGNEEDHNITKPTDVLARLAVFMHLPALRKPPLLRQCLSVFFAAYVCPPRGGNPAKAAERMRLLELTVGPAMEYAVRVEGTLEFAVKLARFLLRLVLAGTQMAAASSRGDIINTEAVARMQSRVILDLAGRAYKQVDEGGPLGRVYCFIISKCLLPFIDYERTETIKLLLAYVELLMSRSSDSISKKALRVFCKALKKDKRFKSDFENSKELDAYKEKAIKRVEQQEEEMEVEVKKENVEVNEASENNDDNDVQMSSEAHVEVKEEKESDNDDVISTEENADNADREEENVDNVGREDGNDNENAEVKDEEMEEPKTPRQESEKVCESATPLKTSSTSNFVDLFNNESEEIDGDGDNESQKQVPVPDELELKRRERRKTIAGIPNPDWYVSPTKSQTKMKLYPRRLSMCPVTAPKDIFKDMDDENEMSSDEEVDFYDDVDEPDEKNDTNNKEDNEIENEENEENDAPPPEKKRRVEEDKESENNEEMSDYQMDIPESNVAKVKEEEEEEEVEEKENDENDENGDDDYDDIDFYINENVDIPPKNQRRKSIPALVSNSRDLKDFLDRLGGGSNE